MGIDAICLKSCPIGCEIEEEDEVEGSTTTSLLDGPVMRVVRAVRCEC